MANNTFGQRVSQPWLVRRIIYIIAGLVGVVAAVFFGATADHLDTIDRAVATITPIILAMVSTLAAPKANPGADAAPPTQDPAPDLVPTVADVAQQVIDQIIPAVWPRADSHQTLDALREGLAIQER